MAPIIRTCSSALALALAVAGPALAAPGEPRVDFLRTGGSTFVAAYAAANAGDARRAAMLYASLAAADPSDQLSRRRALSQAILAGDMPLAVRLARSQTRSTLPVEARMLLAADVLRGAQARKEAIDWPPELGFVKAFVEAWTQSDRGRWNEALKILDAGPTDALGPSLVAEHKVLILLANGRTMEAQPFIDPALTGARGRSNRLRIAFASGLMARGQRDAALALLAGNDVTLRAAAANLVAERKPRPMIAAAAQGFSELVVALAVSLDQEDGPALPLALAQVARYSDPGNEQATLLAGLLLGRGGRPDDSLLALRGISEKSPFVSEARDAEIRALLDADRKEEALARARAFVASDDDQAADWLRLGDVLDDMKRHSEAAVAYGGASAAVQSGGPGPELWSIHLLRGAALEQAGQWPQAESALELAYKLSPTNAAVLNYLGYARLERGEKLDEAEALIAEASRRAPDDASITDSLGWAQYKRGKFGEAILTLQRAAAADPAQAEIHEHLGDALYAAGRKYEARFAWNAALVTAEENVAARVRTKIDRGLSPATAAP